jgi:hypothetical protein
MKQGRNEQRQVTIAFYKKEMVKTTEMKNRKIFTTIAFVLVWKIMQAQSPDMHPPTVPEPVENPVLYILLTVAVIAIYFIYRYSQKRNREKEIKKKTTNKNVYYGLENRKQKACKRI